MKSSICLLTLLGLSSVSSFGQGYVAFRNFDQNLSVMNLVYESDTGNTATSIYWAQLYVGAAGAAEGALTPVGTPQAFGDIPFDGLFIGGEVANPYVSAGATGSFQVRAWLTNYATWDLAYASALNNNTQHIGKSAVFQNPTGTSGHGVDIVNNMPSFTVDIIPEPSTLALMGLGTGALLIRRRMRQA